jgi:hypothetical protein
MRELIRKWRSKYNPNWKLRVYDLNKRNSLGKNVLGYEFYDKKALIFKGEDFCCSPLHAVDSLNVVASILTFLSLCPGDTDAEYFEDYTQQQIEWRDQNAEMLDNEVSEMEERLEKKRKTLRKS